MMLFLCPLLNRLNGLFKQQDYCYHSSCFKIRLSKYFFLLTKSSGYQPVKLLSYIYGINILHILL